MGSNDMPELGSRISLISKADIRYEGKLFTVDPQDCTIALANVRSFGTEDRETAHPVPAQAQVYDYILFRATDIKDISVIPSQQLIYDPAIVQVNGSRLSVPPSLENARGFQGGSGGGSSGFNHPIVGSMGGGGGFQGPAGFNPMQSGLQTLGQPRSQPISELHHASTSSDLLSGSRSSTPGLRKVSPSVDQGIQAKLSSPPKDKPRNQQQGRPGGGGGNQQKIPPRNNQQQTRNCDNQDMKPFGSAWSRDDYGGRRFDNQDMKGFGSSWPRDDYGVRHYDNQNIWGSQQQSLRGGGGGQKWNGGGGNRGLRGGGGQQAQRGSRGGGGRGFPRAPGAGQPKKPLKFETDYDFDKANTEFEELRSELAKVKISATLEGEAPNGETEKKDDSGNETGVGEGEQEEIEVFYDKAKSFFDNISCEAIERSKGSNSLGYQQPSWISSDATTAGFPWMNLRSQRTDWRKERKLNNETFGVAMTRRQGGYRGGRGGYYYQRVGYYQQKRGGSGYRGFRQPNKQPHSQLTTTVEVAKA